jgi:hypothetical protein
MANNMSEVFFLEHRNTEIEIELDNKRIRMVVGPHTTVFLTPGEADQLSTMLLEAATGKGQYEDWDGKYETAGQDPTEDWDSDTPEENPYGEVPW